MRQTAGVAPAAAGGSRNTFSRMQTPSIDARHGSQPAVGRQHPDKSGGPGQWQRLATETDDLAARQAGEALGVHTHLRVGVETGVGGQQQVRDPSPGQGLADLVERVRCLAPERSAGGAHRAPR